ncbi:8335_t:CDS:2 [Acaulospora morrowiae]|uniref:Ubiquinone biosynthesis O-methyltransferase, mitochondrial n=1 Tax=Acaulospora morrowiae TaxID=94023 RepID=A0A9N8YT48_9GLOM|nr:8335_t:CDS:2 [Acaulospora morrowiae]
MSKLCSIIKGTQFTKLINSATFLHPTRNFARSHRIANLQTESFPSNPDPSSSKFSTVNEAEILKFSQLAEEWWSPNGPVKLLHSMNPLRVAYMRRQYSKCSEERGENHFPFKGLRILDIGCGGGVLAESLSRLGGSVVGADASWENIQIAKSHALKDPMLHLGPGKLEYRCITAEKLLEQGEIFDIVCAMEIIEHVNNPLEFLRTCAGMVKAGGGHLFLSTISRTPLSYFLTILLAEKILGVVPNGTHDFSGYIRPDEIQQEVQNLKADNDNNATNDSHASERWGAVTDVTGIGLNPITGRWFEFYKWVPKRIQLDVNYLLTARRA